MYIQTLILGFRWFKQGDPLSLLLFKLAADVLCSLLEEAREVSLLEDLKLG